MPEQRADVAQTLIRRALAAGVMESAIVQRLEELAATSPAIGEVRKWLVGAGGLNEFQLKQLMLGKSGRIRLGPYVLIEPLGTGGMGEVFLARHSLMQREVALKTVRPQWVDDQSLVQRFMREIVNAAKLSHPNIVTAHDAGEDDGVLYLAMEYLRGRTLTEVMSGQGQLAWREAVDFIRQAALGLAYAHENHMIHRDVKPDNLMLVEPSVVKVMDLGLSRVRSHHAESTDGLTGTGSVMGTVDYVAPEQARDARSADERADIYSLGCTLYYFLSGEPPFPGGSLTEKILRHLTEPAPDLLRFCDAPPALSGLTKSMMAKTPNDRPSSMNEVIAALDHVAQQDQTTSTVSTSTQAKTSGTLISPMAAGTELIPRATERMTEPPPGSSSERIGNRRASRLGWIWGTVGGVALVTFAIVVSLLWPPVGDRQLASDSEPPVVPIEPARSDPVDIPAAVPEEWANPRENIPDLSNAQLPHIVSVATTDKQPASLPYLAAFGWEDMSDVTYTEATSGVSIWDLAKVIPIVWLPTNGPVTTLSFAPNGQRLAAGTGSWESTNNPQTPGGDIWVWKLNENGFEVPLRISVPKTRVLGTVTWWKDSNGKTWLVSGGWSDDHRLDEVGINLWDPFNGKWQAGMSTGDGHGVRRLAVADALDLCVVATCGSFDPVRGCELQLWDLDSRSKLKTHRIAEPLVYQISVSPTNDYAFVATGYGKRDMLVDKEIASRPGRLYRWRLDQDQPEIVAESEPTNEKGNPTDIVAVSFGIDSDARRILWATEEGRVTWADVGSDGMLSNHTPGTRPQVGKVFFAHGVTSTTAVFGGSGLNAQLIYPEGQGGIDFLNPPPRDQ